jgi:hypothetical protein
MRELHSQIMTIEEFRDRHVMLTDICVVCKNPIHIMCRKQTGICSENCQKAIKETPNA